MSLAWFPAWILAWVPGRGAKRRILEKIRRRGPGVLRRERRRSPAECSHGDESCVTRFSGGTDEKRRGIPATVRKVVWPGFPGERTRSPAGSRNVNESCVASLFFIGVGGSGRRPSRIRRPRRACGALEIQYTEKSIMSSTVEQNRGEGGWAAKVVVELQSPVFGGLVVKWRLSPTKSSKGQCKVRGLSPCGG